VMLSIGMATPSILDETSLELLGRARQSLGTRRRERPVRAVNDALATLLLPR
jgi:hypothetical protein